MNFRFIKYRHRYINNNCFNSVRSLIAFIGVLCTLTSCTSSKNIRYFSNISDSSVVRLPDFKKPQAFIMPDDILEIKIAGANETTSALLNTYSSTSALNASNYLVDNNGDIEFPLIGKLKAAGLTKEQFRDVLKEKASKYLKDPLINVRFINFRFTVLGEVKTPGTFTTVNEKVTILEAMGLAGDLTNYGKRANVRVIRDSLGKREIGIINFNDKAIFTSPYYYLQRNDVIYIEPEKYKSKYEDFSRVTSVIATLASLVAIAITVLKK